MLFPGIKKLGKELQLKTTGFAVAGLLGNCYIKAYDGKNLKILEISLPSISEDIKDEIKKITVEHKIKAANWHLNTIVIMFSEILKPYPIQKIKELAIEITDYAKSSCSGQTVSCFACDSPGEKIFFIDSTDLFLCSGCEIKKKNEMEKEIEKIKKAPDNYLKGFISAFAFSLPGIAVSVLFFIFLSNIVAFSSVIFVWLATYGYKKMKGKMDKTGALIVNGTGIIMTVAGIAFSYLIFIYTQVRSFSLLFQVLKAPAVQQELMANVILSLLVSSLFIIFNIIQMMKNWRFPELKEAQPIK